MTPAELAEKLERLDALFVELYNYAEVERDKIRAGEGNAVHALNSIRHTIGGRYNVIPQAAARLRRMEEALRPFESAGCVLSQDNGWSNTDDLDLEASDGGMAAIAVFKVSDFRKARAALSGEGQ